MGTLAKVAIGVAAAKGIGYMITKRAAGSAGSADGGLLGGPAATQASTSGGQPGLQDILSSILGGQAGQAGGGLGGLLEQLGAATGAAAAGAASKASGGGSFADVLNQSLQNIGEPEAAPTPQQEVTAGLMLRAVLQAVKCDGKLDEGEKKKLLQTLGDASPEEIQFVNRELAAPVDVQGLAKQVPKGQEQQIYTVSVMGIDLDSQAEAQYLANLATALGIGPREVNAIHAKLGIPALFS
jgi:uncharacterized membrane protein YebE (DUF533 family)